MENLVFLSFPLGSIWGLLEKYFSFVCKKYFSGREKINYPNLWPFLLNGKYGFIASASIQKEVFIQFLLLRAK